MRDGASSHLWNVNSDSLTIKIARKKGPQMGGRNVDPNYLRQGGIAGQDAHRTGL